MSNTNLRYSEFAKHIDVDSVWEELDWQPDEDLSNEIEDKGFCPDLWGLHKNGDTTGKFAFNRDKLVYNCWVCGGGTLLSLVMESKKLDYQEATNWLFKFTKPVDQSPAEFYGEIQRLLESDDEKEPPLPYFNTRVLDPWVNQSHNWFNTRNISKDVREYFKLGFNPQARQYHPKHGSYEGSAIVLPHFWKDGKLVGWQHRWMNTTPRWVPKYTNTSEFPRERTLWGYHFCLVQDKQPIIVESVPTALMLISAGYPAIATFGAEVTPTQLKLLRVFQQGVLLASDNDGAGSKWLATNTNYLERYIPVLHVPTVKGVGSDLGDLKPEELSTHLKGTSYGLPKVYPD